MSIKQIIQGHVNEALGKNEDLQESRMNICKECPLLMNGKFGPQCNNSLWLDTETNNTSTVPKDGYIRGCGCRLNAKTRIPDAHCPANKW